MNTRRFHFFILFFSFPLFLSSQPDWKEIKTSGDFCKSYPEKVEFIFKNLNLDFPGLEAVKQSYAKGETANACRLLLEYYRNTKSASLFKKEVPAPAEKINTEADSVLQDIFTFQGVIGKVPRLPDGRLKWDCTGPENDIEWAWALNRHYPVRPVLDAFYETGNIKYIRYIDCFIKDWIISSWPYPEKKSSTAMWRGLEVSFRVKTWAHVFFSLIQTDFISPATKLLILSSLPDHAHYARNFHGQNNWLTMEISGLATVAAFWPEFKNTPDWLAYTTHTMVESMKEQVYPDGAQTELTSSYHHVALSNFLLYEEICGKAGITLPDFYTKTIESMWNYLVLTIRPDGFGILNNDADLANNRQNVLNAAIKYKRKDWEFMAANGDKGIEPETGPSYFFPWAGHLISRNGYEKDAHWSFFDIGPWGSGHQHNDKLNLTLVANGRDLLVDGGRFAYRGAIAEKFRKYATGSKSHNVILVDGKGQAAGPTHSQSAISESQYKIAPDFDFACGSFGQFSGLEGKCEHKRSLLYIRGNLWVVVDHISTDRHRKIEALWHWHPDCLVEKGENGIVFSANKKGNLKIMPTGISEWNVALIRGQEQPEIQGWYSPVYNSFGPNVTSVYTTSIGSDQTFVWLLIPSLKKFPEIKAEIVSQNREEISLKITDPKKGVWTATVPFSDSRNAHVNFMQK